MRIPLAFVLSVSACLFSPPELWPSCETYQQKIIRDALASQQAGRFGDAAQALGALENTLQITRPAAFLCLAIVLHNLGSINQDMGRYDIAERFYLRALRIEERHGGERAETTTTMNNLGSLYFETGQHRKAEAVRQKAIDSGIARFGPDHPTVVRLIQNLAAQKYSQGQIREAAELFDRAIVTWRKLGYERSPDFATAVHGVGLIRAKSGDLDNGIQLVQQALAIWTGSSAGGSAAAKAEANLAVFKLARGEAKAAELHWRSAIRRIEQAAGPSSAVTRQLLHGFMDFLRQTRQSSEAREVEARIRHLDKTRGDRHIRSSIVDVTELSNIDVTELSNCHTCR